LLGASGAEFELNAVVDTGFTGMLTLPSQVIAALGLRYVGTAAGLLADSSVHVSRRFAGIVRWLGQDREIRLLESEGGVLLGMAMLQGHRRIIDAIDNGRVSIERMST